MSEPDNVGELVIAFNAHIKADEKAFKGFEKTIKDGFDELKREHLEPIKVQTAKTNGRVNWLEKFAWVAIGALSIIGPVLIWVLVDYMDFKDGVSREIKDSVSSALDERVEKVVLPIK